MVIIFFKIDGIQIPTPLYNSYLDGIVGKIFKLLPIYENCELSLDKDFYPFLSHLDKLTIQLKGSDILFENSIFIELTSTLYGMKEIENTNKKKMKSLVFHCIDIVGKLKKEMTDSE